MRMAGTSPAGSDAAKRRNDRVITANCGIHILRTRFSLLHGTMRLDRAYLAGTRRGDAKYATERSACPSRLRTKRQKRYLGAYSARCNCTIRGKGPFHLMKEKLERPSLGLGSLSG